MRKQYDIALVDVDGVLCDFISGYLGLVKRITGKTFKHSDVSDWSFKKCLGLTDEEEAAANQLMYEPGFVRGLSSLADAHDGMRYLSEKAGRIVFVTAAWQGHPTWANEREEWLNERWPDCHIISTHHKYYVSGDMLIDDRPSHIQKWELEQCNYGFLIDAPYNKQYETSRRYSGLMELVSSL